MTSQMEASCLALCDSGMRVTMLNSRMIACTLLNTIKLTCALMGSSPAQAGGDGVECGGRRDGRCVQDGHVRVGKCSAI